MSSSDLPDPSPYESDSGTGDMLEYFQYIHVVAQRYVSFSIGPIDSDDVAQEAWIKFWLIYQKQPIESPKAYIRRIVFTVIADFVRKYKPHLFQALSSDEHGELREGHLINAEESELRNPETIVEQQQSLDETMKKLVGAVAELPPRQKQSAVCALKERVDDLLQFVEALQENAIDSELDWPMEKVERQRLQASFSHARRSIAHNMHIDLDEYS